MLLPQQPMSQDPLFPLFFYNCHTDSREHQRSVGPRRKPADSLRVQALPASAHAQEQLRVCGVGPSSEGGALATWVGDVISGRRG